MALLTIETDFALLQPMLNHDMPDGVTFVSDFPTLKRGIDWNVAVNVTVDVTLHINLGVVTAAVVAGWLVPRLRKALGNHRVRLGEREISSHDPDAVKLIAEKIESDDERN